LKITPQDAEGLSGGDQAPVSVLACGGSLPVEVARILRSKGREPNVVTIRGMADADFSSFTHSTVGIGEVGALLRALRATGAQDVMIAGHAHRPDLRRVKVDIGFVRNIFSILRLTRGGDDGLMRKIARFFEGHGFTVRGIAELTPELLTPPGVLAGPLDLDSRASAEAGLRLVHALGPFDVGQAVIVEAGRVLAIEGAEGTNGLIARQSNTSSDPVRPRVLVKAAKPDQDLRLDMPTIGPETITRCEATNIAAVALEAKRSLIVARAETVDLATRSRVAIVGLEAAQQLDRTQPADATATSSQLRSHARRSPGRLDQLNIIKGLRLLGVLAHHCAVKGAVLARDNVLAINVDDPMPGFSERCTQLCQWGDQRRTKRVQTLVVSSIGPLLEEGFIESLSGSQIAGIVLACEATDATLDEGVRLANQNGLFFLSVA